MVGDTYSTIGLNDPQELAVQWIVRISSGDRILSNVLEEMEPWKLESTAVPFIIKFFENPKFNFFNFFPGAVNLKAHDCIHVLLGRGILPKDEAFVIGFTMGSTGGFGRFKEWLFLFITRHLYPEGYKFKEGEAEVFKGAVDLALHMDCADLSRVDFSKYMDYNLRDLRRELGICEKKLRLRYAFEKKVYRNSVESQRLIL